MITYEQVKNDKSINTYIEQADRALISMGFTEHSFAHVTKVAHDAAYILTELGYDAHTVEIAKIAGYLHDIGNLVNRNSHSLTGAVMAFRILDRMGMNPDDLSAIVSAIGNHDEGTGFAVNPFAAALIIADKSDVRRSRVRNSDIKNFDIHDRVNYSVEKAELLLDVQNKTITLDLKIDTQISPVMEYFEIFLTRMNMCRTAAQTLGLNYSLIINGQKII